MSAPRPIDSAADAVALVRATVLDPDAATTVLDAMTEHELRLTALALARLVPLARTMAPDLSLDAWLDAMAEHLDPEADQ